MTFTVEKTHHIEIPAELFVKLAKLLPDKYRVNEGVIQMQYDRHSYVRFTASYLNVRELEGEK